MSKFVNKKQVNIFLDMDYDIYKYRIKKYIFSHIGFMYEIFDEDFNDNFTKLYILYKKNLLNKEEKIYTDILIDFFNFLKKINSIDQEEYFYLIMKLINIYIFIQLKMLKNINDNDNDNDNNNKKEINIYIELINIILLNNKTILCINKISTENVIMQLFILFINKDNKQIKENIIFMGEKLSIDYFMYWNSSELYKLIKKHINITDNDLIISIKNYKNDFINSYNYTCNTLKELYLDQINTNLILKYKFNQKYDLFNELIKDINAIDKQFIPL